MRTKQRTTALSVSMEPTLSGALCEAVGQNRKRAQFARQAVGVALGFTRPPIKHALDDLLTRYPRLDRITALEAALNFYTHAALTHGLDGQWEPCVPASSPYKRSTSPQQRRKHGETR